MTRGAPLAPKVTPPEATFAAYPKATAFKSAAALVVVLAPINVFEAPVVAFPALYPTNVLSDAVVRL